MSQRLAIYAMSRPLPDIFRVRRTKKSQKTAAIQATRNKLRRALSDMSGLIGSVAGSCHTDGFELTRHFDPVPGLKLRGNAGGHVGQFFSMRIAPKQSLDKGLGTPDGENPSVGAIFNEIGRSTVRCRKNRKSGCCCLREHAGKTVLECRKDKQIGSIVDFWQLALAPLTQDFCVRSKLGKDAPCLGGYGPYKNEFKIPVRKLSRNLCKIPHPLLERDISNIK